MSSAGRETSRDRELVLKHQHSFSESSRLSIPMWDSSDPDRAPPPLPLNPSTSSPLTRPNTSANVAAAAEAFAAKARESMYIANPLPSKSPEKSLIKGQYHKRMQSLHNSNGHIQDLNSCLENLRSPERSLERPKLSYDNENRSPERSPTRSGTPTPVSKDLGKDFLSLRATPRPPPKAILGEASPQSTTMLALQNTPISKDEDSSLANVTNGASALVRTPQTFDALSTQILGLTSIATNLQREMAQLSRRSKDNATDLVSLKEATNARDEDIRKSLRDLVSNLTVNVSETGKESLNRNASQYAQAARSYLLDSKAHNSSTVLPKSISLPKIPSPASFAAFLERDNNGSLNPFSVDGAAGLALLEKILREMGTKEGQERLLSSVLKLGYPSTGKNSDQAVSKQLGEIMEYLKDHLDSHALVARNQENRVGSQPLKFDLDFENPRFMPVSSRDISQYTNTNGVSSQKACASLRADFVSDDILKLLKRMKDSISEGGGMSAEIKALVRELRGEVLGMGREIGRKLDHAESIQKTSSSKTDAQGPGRGEIALIVEEGLANLKEHMDRVMGDHLHQSSSSTISQNNVDCQEIYHAVKNALKDFPILQQATAQQARSGIEREEILEAVREAWETYKPEIELQNFGLERDEILQCLKEGLQEYRPQDGTGDLKGVNYDEVLDAVREGLNDFKPPAPPETEAAVTREEILMAVRESLECFEFPFSQSRQEKDTELTREDVLDAVKEGLSSQGALAREPEFNREDLLDAVKVGLDGVSGSLGGVGEQVLDKMQDLIDGIRGEFQQYSSANGRDTEQVLDAMKDGLETLRTSIETLVDRAADVTGKKDIIDSVRGGLDQLKIDLESSIANAPHGPGSASGGELLDAMEKEFEHLRQTVTVSLKGSGTSSGDNEDILDAIRDGFDEIKDQLPRGSDREFNTKTLTLIREEFEYWRITLASTLIRNGPSVEKEEIAHTIRNSLESVRTKAEKGDGKPESISSNTSELLNAFNEGLDSLKADMEKLINKPIDMTVNYEILDTLKDGFTSVRADIDRLHLAQAEQESSISSRRGGEVVIADREARSLGRTDIENLEGMITQLQIKVEALDNSPPVVSTERNTNFEKLEMMIKETQAAVGVLNERERSQVENMATKDDTDAIETLLRNTKAQIDDFVFPEQEGVARTEHLKSVETILNSTRDAVEDLAARSEVESASKQDVGILEVLLKEIRTALDEMREKDFNKNDLEILEALCLDTKSHLEELALPDVETLPTKLEIQALSGIIRDFSEKFDVEADLTAQAFESRKIEHGGIADKIEDVRSILVNVQAELKLKNEGNEQGIQNLTQALEFTNETVITNSAGPAVKELFDIVNREFDRVRGNHEAMKVDTKQLFSEKHEENRAAIIGNLSSKIDERFDELMTKYDDAQIAVDAAAARLKDKDARQTEIFNITRAVTEDLKLLVDSLGTTVIESCERVGGDSKTVFSQVEDLGSKLDEIVNTITSVEKTEHQLTRADLSKTLVAVEGMQVHTSEYHPKIMSAITDVLNIVGQHYEQAQQSTEELKVSVNNIPMAISFSAIAAQNPIPAIEGKSPERYGDSEVHAKLDKLIQCATEIGKRAAQFDMLEQIKGQVAATATEFATFVTAQQAMITETRNLRAREVAESTIALEKRITQKEVVEFDIVRLSEERSILVMDVDNLKQEEKGLLAQKSKMLADLSGLETAIQIRREEMEYMESRAEALERRILEGVLNHSRSLLVTSNPQSSLGTMNLKRVSRAASPSASTVTTIPSSAEFAPSRVASGIGMALKRRQPTQNAFSKATKSRRILSLNTISANKANFAEKSMVLASPSTTNAGASKGITAFGSGPLKRSHSLKSNFPTRKPSWDGSRQVGVCGNDLNEEDKENSILDEEDEDRCSEAGTERRTSYGTGTDGRTSCSCTYTTTYSHATDSVAGDLRTSYVTSTVGTLGMRDDHMDNAGSESGSEPGCAVDKPAASNQNVALYQHSLQPGLETLQSPRQVTVYGMPTDSGIGSELPTAGLEVPPEYFRKD